MTRKVSAWRRRRARFSPPDDVAVFHQLVRLPLLDVGEAGFRISTKGHAFCAVSETKRFRLVLRDSGAERGFDVLASCRWWKNGEAGFDFVEDGDYAPALRQALLAAMSAGRSRIISGHEIRESESA